MTRRHIFLIGIASTMAFSAIWHGPVGAGDRLAAHAELIARRTLDYYELPIIQARLARRPMARTIVLSGPADDFQRRELVRVMNQVPAILAVRWDPGSLPQESVAQPPQEMGKTR
ncbi:MAG: hypothetical protein ABIP07_05410 [Sphingomicrobium sp.]